MKIEDWKDIIKILNELSVYDDEMFSPKVQGIIGTRCHQLKHKLKRFITNKSDTKGAASALVDAIADEWME